MNVGTKSIFVGAHQCILHPIALAIAWTRLYGLPLDFRLLISFAVHDLGYFGLENTAGKEGDRHPIRGAAIMRMFFGKAWGDFTLYHSRNYARKRNRPYSRLAVADKLATTILPAWLYVPMVCLTGEIDEYMSYTAGKDASFHSQGAITGDVWLWHSELCDFLRQWAFDHKDVATPIRVAQTTPTVLRRTESPVL